MPDFGVLGLGSVGWAVVHGFCAQGYTYSVYDKTGEYDWGQIIDTKAIFICTSTPPDSQGRLDCSSIIDALEKLAHSGYSGLVVVKSTVSIGFMDKATLDYPSLRLLYMPEFLRERSCFTWFVKPDRIVVAGVEEDVEEVLHFFEWAENAEIIITDFKSAELGKLAHNSFIATKVTFTNEIERMSTEINASPHDAMNIVWSDRRVSSCEHLTPGLGPYGGKCVKKDVNELIEHSKSPLLDVVRRLNSNIDLPEIKVNYPSISVIIPMNHEVRFIERALDSVSNQTFKPEKVVIVTDTEYDFSDELDLLINRYAKELNVDHINNNRTQNISGAINTGLFHLKDLSLGDDGFIALLDDDDWWERRYLENCTKYAYETKSDWVVPGLVRYDENNTKGIMQMIPPEIRISDFLTGNPNVQGSNLFVKLDSLTGVGGFDEALPSTTDRDIAIRMLQENTRYAVLFNHLVHHDAFNRPERLSHPGSEIKKKGLTAFYSKHRPLMTNEQRTQFKDRALALFNVRITEGE